MDAGTDLTWLFIIIVLLWFAWVVTGGAVRQEALAGPFIKPPAPLNSGVTYGPVSDVNLLGRRVSK